MQPILTFASELKRLEWQYDVHTSGVAFAQAENCESLIRYAANRSSAVQTLRKQKMEDMIQLAALLEREGR